MCPRIRAAELDADAGVDPLYLLACGVRWQRHSDLEAGWELVHARVLERAGSGRLHKPSSSARNPSRECEFGPGSVGGGSNFIDTAGPGTWGENSEEEGRKTPYGLEIVENCQKCPLRREAYFCNLSAVVLNAFNGISHQTTFPGGATLFVEGQTSRGVFILCSGKVKLSTSSRDGKVLILKMATAGDILGLSAVASGQPYKLTAETAVLCHVNFVQREALLALLERFGEAACVLRSRSAASSSLPIATSVI